MKRRLGIFLGLMLGISLFLSGCGAGSLLDKAEFEFNGYNQHGSAELKSASKLAVLKEVALYEGKKAKVSTKTMETFVDNATSVDDLESNTGFSQISAAADETEKIQNYLTHINETVINGDSADGLKNGQKITLKLTDQSGEPYFKTISKTFKVKGLKKQTKITTFKKSDFKGQLSGTNHHGTIQIMYTAHGRNINVTEAFTKKNKNFNNGDKISASTTALADALNDGGQYLYVGQKNQKIKLTVSGLQSDTVQISNLKAINQAIKTKAGETLGDSPNDNQLDPRKGTLVHAYFNLIGEHASFVYKLPDNKYLELRFNAKIKNKTLYVRDKDSEHNGESLDKGLEIRWYDLDEKTDMSDPNINQRDPYLADKDDPNIVNIKLS